MNKIFYLTALHFIEIFLKDGGFHSAISKSDQGCYFIIEQILEISRPELEFIDMLTPTTRTYLKAITEKGGSNNVS